MQLRHEWPSFAAYVLSFFIIGVIWVNHHALFALAARVDRALLFYNLLLLMWVTTIPFTTSTLASFLRSGGSDTRWAVVLYGVLDGRNGHQLHAHPGPPAAAPIGGPTGVSS